MTKHTTLVIVGAQDVQRLKGTEISAEHQKARNLIAKGIPLKVITESDFRPSHKVKTDPPAAPLL